MWRGCRKQLQTANLVTLGARDPPENIGIAVEVRNVLRIYAFIAILSFSLSTLAQDTADGIQDLKLRDWKPRSMLVTKETRIDRPAFPVIDVHNHLGGGAKHLTPKRVQDYLQAMDEAGV